MRSIIQTYINKFRRRDLTMQAFFLAKVASLLVPFVHHDAQFMCVIAFANILEAVAVDVVYKCYSNAVLGLALACSLLRIESCFIFQLWCAFYFAWNARFCLNRGWPMESAVGNNLPSLYVAVTYKSDNVAVCLNKWLTGRVASILTQIISNLKNI